MLRASNFSVFVSAFDECAKNCTSGSPGSPGAPGSGGAFVVKTKSRASPPFAAPSFDVRCGGGVIVLSSFLSTTTFSGSPDSVLKLNSMCGSLRATFERGSNM